LGSFITNLQVKTQQQIYKLKEKLTTHNSETLTVTDRITIPTCQVPAIYKSVIKLDIGHSKMQFSKPTTSSQIKALVCTDIFTYFYTANFSNCNNSFSSTWFSYTPVKRPFIRAQKWNSAYALRIFQSSWKIHKK